MRALATLVAALAPVAPIATGACSQASPSGDVASAGELFRERCAGCHLPPDGAFAVDRAWLEQVRSTA